MTKTKVKRKRDPDLTWVIGYENGKLRVRINGGPPKRLRLPKDEWQRTLTVDPYGRMHWHTYAPFTLNYVRLSRDGTRVLGKYEFDYPAPSAIAAAARRN